MQELLHERAALYAAGALAAPERTEFELLLEFHEELQAHVSRLQEAATAGLLDGLTEYTPPAGLKDRILAAVEADALVTNAGQGVAKVRTGPTGLVEWVNPEFTALCGYKLEELRGKKAGQLIQGPQTDRAALARIRSAMNACRPIEEHLVNYHKDGSVYRVHVAITPILGDDRQPLFFVAKERKLAMAG